MPTWRLAPAAETRLLDVILAEEWADHSSAVIAQHLNLAVKVVRQYRHHYGVSPQVITCADGRKIRKGMIGQGEGRTLTDKQRQMLEQAAPEADKWAGIEDRKSRHKIFSLDELVSIAYDAILVAVLYFDDKKLKGQERSPGSKWKGYAVNGIKRAFRREAYKRRRSRKRMAFFGDAAERSRVSSERLKERLATGDHLPQLDIPDGVYAKLQAIGTTHRLILEGMLGLDGKPPWKLEDLAAFWGVELWKAARMYDEAKQALLE